MISSAKNDVIQCVDNCSVFEKPEYQILERERKREDECFLNPFTKHWVLSICQVFLLLMNYVLYILYKNNIRKSPKVTNESILLLFLCYSRKYELGKWKKYYKIQNRLEV